MIVADVWALIDLLLNGRVPRRRSKPSVSGAPSTPHLVETEVLHALRRWVGAGSVDAGRAGAALEDLGDLPLVHHARAPLRERVWSHRERLSAHDATYVALVEALDATLVTAEVAWPERRASSCPRSRLRDRALPTQVDRAHRLIGTPSTGIPAVGTLV